MDMHIAAEKLGALQADIDLKKCHAEIGESRDGFFLETKTEDSRYCPVRIEVTPWTFDVSAGDRFVESDVSHEDFDFADVICSIMAGRARVIATKILCLIPRVVLEISLSNGSHFYMARDGILPDLRGLGKVYSRYLK